MMNQIIYNIIEPPVMNRAFAIDIILNLAYVVIEAVYG